MRLERTKNAKKSAIWGLASKIVGLFFPFVVRSVIIRTIGIEYIGLNGLFTSILDILNLTELGVGAAIVYSMYKPIAEDDTDTICALMNLYKKVYRWIGAIVLLIGLCLLPFLGYLVKGDVPSDVNLYVLYLIYLSNSVITYWLFAYKTCLLNAYQRNDVVSKVSMALSVALNILQIVVLISFHSYYSFVIINPLIGILTNIINAHYAEKLFPKYRCKGMITKEMAYDIRKRIAGLMMTKIAYRARYSLGNIVVSAFLGLQVIAVYNNYYYVLLAVSGLFAVVISSITAGIGNSIAMETKEKNENDMEIMTFLYMSISFFSFCCMLALYQPFMTLWAGEEYTFSTEIMILFSVFFLVDKSLNVIGIYYDAAGLWWEGKWKGFVEASLHIALTITLTHLYGVKGALIAAICSVVLVGLPLTSYYMYKFYYQKSAIKYIIKLITQIICFVAIGSAAYSISSMLSHSLCIDSWLMSSGFTALLTIVTSVGLYIVIFCKTKLFQHSMCWVKKHFNSKK